MGAAVYITVTWFKAARYNRDANTEFEVGNFFNNTEVFVLEISAGISSVRPFSHSNLADPTLKDSSPQAKYLYHRNKVKKGKEKEYPPVPEKNVAIDWSDEKGKHGHVVKLCLRDNSKVPYPHEGFRPTPVFAPDSARGGPFQIDNSRGCPLRNAPR